MDNSSIIETIEEFYPENPPWPKGSLVSPVKYPYYKYSYPQGEDVGNQQIATVSWVNENINDTSIADDKIAAATVNGKTVSDLKHKLIDINLIKNAVYSPRSGVTNVALLQAKIDPFCSRYSDYTKAGGGISTAFNQCVLQKDLISRNTIPVKFKINSTTNLSKTYVESCVITVGGVKVYAYQNGRQQISDVDYIYGYLTYSSTSGATKGNSGFPFGYQNLTFTGDHYNSTADTAKKYQVIPKVTITSYDYSNNKLQDYSLTSQVASGDLTIGGQTYKQDRIPAGCTNGGRLYGCVYPKYIASANTNGDSSHHEGYGYVRIGDDMFSSIQGGIDTVKYLLMTLSFDIAEDTQCPDALKLFKLDVEFTSAAKDAYTISNYYMFSNGYRLYHIFKGRDGKASTDGKQEWWFSGDAAKGLPDTFISPYIKYSEGTSLTNGDKCFSIDLRAKPIKDSSGTLVKSSISNAESDFITTLGSKVFKGCYLNDVILPTKLETIPASAFSNSTILGQIKQQRYDSTSLEALSGSYSNTKYSDSVPKVNLKTIGMYAFSQAQFVRYQGFSLPTVTILSDHCFAQSNITSICVSRYLSQLEHSAFSGCSKLSSFIHTGISSAALNDGSFNIHIPPSVSEIGNSCFYHAMTYDEARYGWRLRNKNPNTYLYDNTTHYYVAIHFTNSVKSIGEYAFEFSDNTHGLTTDFSSDEQGSSLYNEVVNAVNTNECSLHRVYYTGTIQEYCQTNFGKNWMDRFWYFYQRNTSSSSYLKITQLSLYPLTTGIQKTFNINLLANDIILDKQYSYGTSLFQTEPCIYDVPPYAFRACWSIDTLVFYKKSGSSHRGLTIGDYAFSECCGIHKMMRSSMTNVAGSLYRLCQGAFNQCRYVELNSGFFVDNFNVKYLGTDCLRYYGGRNTQNTEDNFTFHLESVIQCNSNPITVLAQGTNRTGNTAQIYLRDLQYVHRDFYKCTIANDNPKSCKSRIYFQSGTAQATVGGVVTLAFRVFDFSNPYYDSEQKVWKNGPLVTYSYARFAPITTHIHVVKGTKKGCLQYQFSDFYNSSIIEDD